MLPLPGETTTELTSLPRWEHMLTLSVAKSVVRRMLALEQLYAA